MSPGDVLFRKDGTETLIVLSTDGDEGTFLAFDIDDSTPYTFTSSIAIMSAFHEVDNG